MYVCIVRVSMHACARLCVCARVRINRHTRHVHVACMMRAVRVCVVRVYVWVGGCQRAYVSVLLYLWTAHALCVLVHMYVWACACARACGRLARERFAVCVRGVCARARMHVHTHSNTQA